MGENEIARFNAACWSGVRVVAFARCRYDPTALIGSLEDAQEAAETLLSMSAVGFGRTQARPAADNGM